MATSVDDYTTIGIKGRLFADCTGDGALGVLAGAEWHMGRDPKSRYNEPSAPETADGITLGASVQWYCLEAERPVPFPDIDWGLPISEETVQKVRRGQWYWEVGMVEDQMAEAERIRDYGMYVAYSNWAYIKNHASFRDEYANSYLGWMAHVAGKRESRRLVGEFVLREQDLTDFVVYPDGCVSTSWYIDNHEPDPENSKHFREPFLSRGCLRPLDFYPIPYRCFYSKDLDNLFMAGRNISVSHIALGTTRVMRTTAMMGEVVGLAGLMGAGRTEIVETIFGKNRRYSGQVKVNGQALEIDTPRDAINAGIAYIPRERKDDGLVMTETVKNNMTLVYLDKLMKCGKLDLKEERSIVDGWVKRLKVKTPSTATPIESLSGGNQQKVIVGKWMMMNPKVIILNEPTRGIDVAAKREIYYLINELCMEGMAVLIISSETPEIMGISDRIIVVHEGKITGECARGAFDQEKIMCYAIGEDTL